MRQKNLPAVRLFYELVTHDDAAVLYWVVYNSTSRINAATLSFPCSFNISQGGLGGDRLGREKTFSNRVKRAGEALGSAVYDTYFVQCSVQTRLGQDVPRDSDPIVQQCYEHHQANQCGAMLLGICSEPWSVHHHRKGTLHLQGMNRGRSQY